MSEMTTIMISGVKLEVDLREAKKIETLRVGDKCKLLVDPSYGDPKVYHAIIVGFEPFKKLPSIIVAYVEQEYNRADLKFIAINEKTTGYELIKMVEDLPIDREGIHDIFDRQLKEHERKIEDIQEKREYFMKNFATYWEPVATACEVVGPDTDV